MKAFTYNLGEIGAPKPIIPGQKKVNAFDPSSHVCWSRLLLNENVRFNA